MKNPLVYFTVISLTCAALLLLAVTVVAQDAQRGADQSLLPDIDPQDIEIRGQFQARFPGLRRQPILGFTPQPRVFQVDPNRMPFIESEDVVTANLPIGALAGPAGPVYTPLTYADPTRGFARLGIGSDVTPEADIYAMQPLARGQWVSAAIDYRSTDGHLDNQQSSFRLFNANLRSRHSLSSTATLRLHLGAVSNFNYTPSASQAGIFIPETQVRTSEDGFRFGADIEQYSKTITGWKASVNGFTNSFDAETETFSGSLPTQDADEWGVRVRAGYTWPGQRIDELFGAAVSVDAGSIDIFNTGSESWNVVRGAAIYERTFNFRTDLKAEGGVALVDDAVNGSTFYISPSLDVTHTLFRGLDIHAHASGKPQHRSLFDVRQQNRFITLETPLQHQYTLRVQGSVTFEPLTGTTISGGLGYRDVSNHTFFERDVADPTAPDPVLGAYRPQFGDATFFSIFGSFTQHLSPDRLWVGAEGYWQRPRLSGGGEIPFTESVGLRTSVTVRPASQLTVEGWADASGSRFNPHGEDLSSYVLLGAKFELAINRRFGLYGKLLNLTDQEYEIWQGYTERGFQGFIGITTIF
ncbi:MAG: hypothetical protein ACNA78_04425 [Balneolaceae bacterium]